MLLSFLLGTMFATSNKCIASSNKCLTSSNKKLVVTGASLLGASALLVVTIFAIRNKNAFLRFQGYSDDDESCTTEGLNDELTIKL